MFRVKTTRRNVKQRAISPIRPATAATATTATTVTATDISGAQTAPAAAALGKQFTNFFEAESAATSLTKPWLRLERGIRLQKYRVFAEAYPGLLASEQDALYKMLVRANDAKLLNTKQQIVYENGAIQSIKGLKIIRTGDPSVPATFKIEIARATKRHAADDD